MRKFLIPNRALRQAEAELSRRRERSSSFAQQARTNPHQNPWNRMHFSSGHGFSRAKNNRREAPSTRGALPASLWLTQPAPAIQRKQEPAM